MSRIRFHDGDAAKRALGLRKLSSQFYNYAFPRLKAARRPVFAVPLVSACLPALKESPSFLVSHILSQT